MCGNYATGGTLKSVRPAQFSERKGEKGKSEKKKKYAHKTTFWKGSGLQIPTECKYLLAGLSGGI